jgi:RNA polymerase sigma-70 factor (ECF subfamily)
MLWRRGRPKDAGEGFSLSAVIDDDIAFRRWYDETAPRVYAYLLSRTGSHADAEELTQETFIEVVNHPGSFDGRDEIVPWLIGIARHRLAKHFARTKLRDERAQQAVREIRVAGHDDRPLRGVEDRDQVEMALATLQPLQRAALMYRFAEDLPIKDVAAALNRSEHATESLLRRARASFEAAFRGSSDAA